MSNTWNIDVTRDWLPSGEEDSGAPPSMIRRIRDFIDFRTESLKDQSAGFLRDMHGIFADALHVSVTPGQEDFAPQILRG